MKQLDLQEQKQVALGVMCEIDRICRDNGFTYSLSSGTLLGAVRHGGFIPWDDDIDIMMPREDYLKFIEYCKNNEVPFTLASPFTDPKYGYMFSKACDKNTIVIPDNMRWQKDGIQVDIFPVENMGDDEKTVRKRFNKKRWHREMLVAWNWKRYEKNPHKSFAYNVARFLFFVMSRFACHRRLLKSINKYYGKFAAQKTAYCGIICGAYRMREIMPTSIYEEYTEITFEGKSFRTIARYDEYLTKVYGDYMQLPPEDRRVTHHNFKAFWKNEGENK